MAEELKRNIVKMHEKNKKQFNKKRIEAKVCKVDYLIAIQRTRYDKGMKLEEKLHGQNRVRKKRES